MRTITLIAAAGTALLLAPASSGAATWRGKTEQGRLAEVVTKAGGKVDRARFGYRARCNDGKVLNARVAYIAPLRFAGRRGFRDAGRFSFRIGGGERARARTFVRGKRRAGRWAGMLQIRIRVYRRGRYVATCRANGVSWRAQRA